MKGLIRIGHEQLASWYTVSKRMLDRLCAFKTMNIPFKFDLKQSERTYVLTFDLQQFYDLFEINKHHT